MAIIYISSTYKDLIKEREAAAQAVRRLGHRAIAMEDYVATDKRPVDKCLEDVRGCSVYVGIFAWRYGFIPEGYDKSITHLEYKAARKAGIPCLIFLLDETAKWPVNFVSKGEERKNIDKLRQYLQDTHTVSFFTSADELGGLVSPAVSNELKKIISSPPSPSSQIKPRIGPIVPKMCDRIPQVRNFWEFFQPKSRICPKRPHFYFIHGDELAGHESFLERLMSTYLKEFAEKEWGEENTTIYLEEVPWPKEGNLPEREEEMRFNLMTNFNKWYKDTDFTANALSRLPCLKKHPLVLIKHNIYSSKWDKHNMPLLRWYIRKYWAALECNDNIPLFLIFFNVKYQMTKEAGLKKLFKRKDNTPEHIREQLEHISGSSNDECPCLLLKELTAVEIIDVLEWLDKNKIYEPGLERKEKAESIFKDNSDRIVESKPMAEVEKELKKIIEECQREEI